jgi:hypothetical protein
MEVRVGGVGWSAVQARVAKLLLAMQELDMILIAQV